MEHAIKDRIASGITVKLLVGTRSARRAALDVQFAESRGETWQAWSALPENFSKLAYYAKLYKYRAAHFQTQDEFLEFGLRLQDRALDEVYRGAIIQETHDFVPLISWVADDDQAIFAVANSKGRNTGFFTRDKNLIESFLQVHDRYSRVEWALSNQAGRR